MNDIFLIVGYDHDWPELVGWSADGSEAEAIALRMEWERYEARKAMFDGVAWGKVHSPDETGYRFYSVERVAKLSESAAGAD
jgi:hypothetical protein